MIGIPPPRKYTITDKEIWQILINVEMQGGNKIYSHRINKILEEIVERYDK